MIDARIAPQHTEAFAVAMLGVSHAPQLAAELHSLRPAIPPGFDEPIEPFAAGLHPKRWPDADDIGGVGLRDAVAVNRCC